MREDATMSKDRFEKLGLEDRECICPSCEEVFNLKLEHTLSGIYIIRMKCPNCQTIFSVDNIIAPMDTPQPLSKTEEIGLHAKRAIVLGIFIVVCSTLMMWVMMPTDILSPNYFLLASGVSLVGSLLNAIGGVLSLYGLIKLVVLETINELEENSTE
jgi:hypothetical protein